MDEAQAAQPEVPATPAVESAAPTPQSETQPEQDSAKTLAALEAQVEAERAKTQRAVEAERKAREARQAVEAELTGLREKAAADEAERVKNLSLEQRLAETEAALVAAQEREQATFGQWEDFRVTSELERAGFFDGLEGDAKAAQLETVKALTSLPLVQEDGKFSLSRFEVRFGNMKPTKATPEPAPVAAPVVDLGGKLPAPSEGVASARQDLIAQLKEAEKRGNRLGVLDIRYQLSQLK